MSFQKSESFSLSSSYIRILFLRSSFDSVNKMHPWGQTPWYKNAPSGTDPMVHFLNFFNFSIHGDRPLV